MAALRVCFFNRSYYPDQAATGQLLTELAEDLVRVHGCEVLVVAGPALRFVGTGGEAARWGRLFEREWHNGVEIIRTRGTTLRPQRFVGRAMNYVSYFLSACPAGLRVSRPDVVVALTDPPIIGLAGLLAARRVRAASCSSARISSPRWRPCSRTSTATRSTGSAVGEQLLAMYRTATDQSMMAV